MQVEPQPVNRYFRRKWKLDPPIEFEYTHSMTGVEFNTYRTPSVYAWKRDEEWLYIGSTYHGMNRLCDSKHDILGKMKIKDTDTILIMSGLTRFQARSLESRLIRIHKPKYNKHKYLTSRRKYLMTAATVRLKR